MSPLLINALAESRLLDSRGWVRPSDAAQEEAERLLAMVYAYREPSVHVGADGTVVFEWEAAGHGWLTLAVDGNGQLTHSAVIDGDEFGQAEEFGDVLPDWAERLLKRLMRAGN